MAASDLTHLVRALEAFRKKLDNIQRTLRTEKLERQKNQGDDLSIQQLETFHQLTLSPDLAGYFHNLKNLVEREAARYTPAPQPPAAAEDAPDALKVLTTPQLPPSNTLTTPLLVPTTPSAYTRNLFQEADILWESGLTGATPHERYGQLLNIEIKDLTGENPRLSSVGANALPKLKNAQSAYSSERYGDALTILKVTLRNDPHNQTLAFLVSQFLYLLANHGQQNAHPEARELAQKSMIESEKLPPEKTLWYRYHSISAEISHSTERALEWLRDTDIANPKYISEKEGWLKANGCHIKSLILMSKIPSSLWGDRDFELLSNLVHKSLGGSSIYLHIFKPSFLKQDNRKETNEKIKDLDKTIALSYSNYLKLYNGFNYVLHYGNHYPWIIKNRFLLTLVNTANIPAFDHALNNISLNTESWQNGTYPDPEIRISLDDTTISYWRWWALALSHSHEKISHHPLVTDEMMSEESLLGDVENIIQLLANEENKRKRPDIWEKVQPWIVRWELDHLLAAGTGSNQPRQKFSPVLQPFSMYYRRWSEPVPGGPLASEMILKNAQKGGFGNWYEVLAAFEGAIRLLDDPNHGLLAMQKRALSLAKTQDPNRFAGLKVSGSTMDFSKFGALIVPLGFMAGILAATQMARNAGQAIGIILVIMGIAGMVLMSVSQKKR